MQIRRFIILAALTAASPCLAEDRALFHPTRDVAVDYRSSGGARDQGGDHTATMHYTTNGNRMRWENPDGKGYMIMDGDNARMTIVMTAQHMYMDQPADPSKMPIFQGNVAHLVKTGTDTVSGLSCTVYEGEMNAHKGQVCLTDDGVLLRARSHDADDPHEMVAVKVTYGTQDASLFQPPPDFKKFEMPVMPHGMPNGIPGRMPPGMTPH